MSLLAAALLVMPVSLGCGGDDGAAPAPAPSPMDDAGYGEDYEDPAAIDDGAADPVPPADDPVPPADDAGDADDAGEETPEN